MNTRANRRSEKWLERALQDYVIGRGGITVKVSDPTKNGLPDRLVLWPGGVAEFVELKSTGKGPEPLQRLVMKELSQMGIRCTVIDSEIKLQQWQNSIPAHTRPK